MNKKFQLIIALVLVHLLNSCNVELTDKSGLYTSPLPKMSIELQSGGRVFVTPKQNNNTFYCTTTGTWTDVSKTEIKITLESNENCNWLTELDGSWLVDECSTFNGKKTFCISKGTFRLIRDK